MATRCSLSTTDGPLGASGGEDAALHEVYLGLGSNIGDRERTLREATERIGELVGAVVRRSALYETAVCCLTHCSPRRVLELTQQVERELGRTRKSAGGHYADRTIDIDILLYDDLVIDEPDLKVPHPLMREREFVMKPLGEIMPCPQGGLRR